MALPWLRAGACWLALAGASAPGGARAADGDPLDSHRHNLDVFTGPVIGSSRVIGLAGAYVGLAEGVEGLFWNPAAIANRAPHSLDWWDWDLDVGLLFPTSLGEKDFDNDGLTHADVDALTGTFGGALQLGAFAVGVDLALQSYDETYATPAGPRRTTLALNTSHLAIAYAFDRGQFVLGAGLRGTTLDLSGVGQVVGSGVEVGALLRLRGTPFRVGAVWRSRVFSDQNELLPAEGAADDAACARTTPVGDAGLWVPCHLVLPWQAALGASYRLGASQYDAPWENPHEVRDRLRAQVHAEGVRAGSTADEDAETRRRVEADRAEREAALAAAPRRYVILSASLTLDGATPDGLGTRAFAQQVEQRSGARTTVRPAAGAEAEVVPNHLRVRGGTYLEPTRFENPEARARPHGTAGFDVRVLSEGACGGLVPFPLRLSGVVDYAPRYFNFSVGLGVWH